MINPPTVIIKVLIEEDELLLLKKIRDLMKKEAYPGYINVI